MTKDNLDKFTNYYSLGMFNLKSLNHYPPVVYLYKYYIYITVHNTV